MKMRSKTLKGAAVVVAAVGCLVGLMAGVALASTVSDALNAAPGTVVTVEGTVTLIEGNEYMLAGAGGQIKIELGPVWYASYVLDSTQTYTFIGEVDKGKDGLAATAEIDVFTVKDAAGTTTIAEVRSEAGGKPPWAGRGGPHANGQTPGADAPDDDDAAGTPDSD
jgi:uncharacterized protein YdeI (BOF family)